MNIIDLARLCECGHVRMVHELGYGCTVQVGKVVRGWKSQKAIFEIVTCPCEKYREKPSIDMSNLVS